MIALEITDVKVFMNQMLVGELFDSFLLAEAVVTSKITYSIDGHLNLPYFPEEEKLKMIQEEITLIPFPYVKRSLFDMMKGSQTPAFFKLVFMLSPQNVQNTLQSIGSHLTTEDVTGMCMNFTYQADHLTCTTGISYSIFSKEKELEREWDRLVCRFLSKHEIGCQTLI